MVCLRRFESFASGQDANASRRGARQLGDGVELSYAFGGGGSGAVERESGRSLTAAATVTCAIAGDTMVPDSSMLLRADVHDAGIWQSVADGPWQGGCGSSSP